MYQVKEKKVARILGINYSPRAESLGYEGHDHMHISYCEGMLPSQEASAKETLGSGSVARLSISIGSDSVSAVALAGGPQIGSLNLASNDQTFADILAMPSSV